MTRRDRQKNLLKKLITIKLADAPEDVALDLVEIALSGDDDAARADAMGEVVDDAVELGGVAGTLLEAVDDQAAAQVAALTLSAIDVARERIFDKLDDQIEEAEDFLRERGVDDDTIERLRELLVAGRLAA